MIQMTSHQRAALLVHDPRSIALIMLNRRHTEGLADPVPSPLIAGIPSAMARIYHSSGKRTLMPSRYFADGKPILCRSRRWTGPL
jgi:hypothetical protein